MPSVIHIISSRIRPLGESDEGSDLAVLACAAHVRARPDSLVVLLATGQCAARARSLGLKADIVIAPPLGCPELANPLLRLRLRGVDIPGEVHAWGPRVARLARLAGLMPLERRALLEDILPPSKAVDAERLAIRRSLNIDDKALVFLGVAEPAGRFDAFFMMRTLSLLDVASRAVVGLFPRGAARFDRSRRFHRDVGLSMGVVVRDAPWYADASWADFAFLAPGIGTDPMAGLACQSLAKRVLLRAGIPTLIERDLASRAGFGPSDSAQLVIGGRPGHAALAKRTLQYIIDRGDAGVTRHVAAPVLQEAAR